MTDIQLASGKTENYHARMSDDTAPATKADIIRLEGRTQKLEGTVQKLGNDVQRIEKKFDAKFERLYGADDQILTVLTNIDKRLTVKVEDHEKRIVRLEAAVA